MKFITSLLCSFMCFASLTAQVKWLEETHNFGAFAEDDGIVTCKMQFVNISDKPVIINQVHVTCGCTNPSFDKKSIEPGDTGYVTISYNPYGRPGRFEKKIYVDLNTTPSRYALFIKGSVIGSPSTVNEKYPVTAGPLRLRNSIAPFGEVIKGLSKSYFLEVYNASSDTVRPVWQNVPDYMAVGAPSETIFPGENMAYTFMLASDKVGQYGLTTDTLILIPDIALPGNSFPIPFTVLVQEDFSKLTPGQMKNSPIIQTSVSKLNFDEFPIGETISKTLEITNAGNDPLLIRRLYSSTDAITVSIDNNKIKKGKNAMVKVTVNPSLMKEKVLNERITIVSNDPEEPLLNIRISGLKK